MNFNGKCYYKLSLRIQIGYLKKLTVDKFFRVYKQWKRKRYLATIYDIMMKPVHDVNLTKHYLKIMLKARLSILILSKADPS